VVPFLPLPFLPVAFFTGCPFYQLPNLPFPFLPSAFHQLFVSHVTGKQQCEIR